MYVEKIDNDNDLDIILIKYKILCMKEFTYYGNYYSNQMFILVNISQELIKLENKLLKNYYQYIDKSINSNINYNSYVYYIHQILFHVSDTILSMIKILITNKSNLQLDIIEYKNKYLIGFLDHYIQKFIKPIDSHLINFINLINNNDVFYMKNSFNDIDDFLNTNEDKFNNKYNLKLLKKFIKLLN